MELNCYLRTDQPDKQGRMMAQYVVHWNGERLRCSTGQKVVPAEWDEEKQKVKARAPFAATRNKDILSVGSCIQTYFDSGMPTDLTSVDAFLKRLAAAARSGTLENFIPQQQATVPLVQEPALPSVADIFEQYKVEHRSILAHNTLRSYKHIVRYLLDFKPDVVFQDMTTSFFNSFLDYLAEADLSDTTAHQYLSNIRSVVDYADGLGLPTTRAKLRWPTRSNDSVRTWHTEEEVQRIADFRSHPTLQRVAVCYAFACYTGLRVSDLAQFRASLHVFRASEEQGGYRYLRIGHQVKTRKPVSIALSDYALELLERCHGIPWPYDDGDGGHVYTYNRHLKRIGAAAKIDAEVEDVWYKGGQRISQIVPKYSLMSSHIARHTYACMSLMRGMPIHVLKEVMGHADIRSTMVYAKITEQHKHQQTLSAWERKI